MKDYQKILLYLYPKLGGLIRCAEEIVRAKAVASGTDVRTEQCIEKIIEYIRFRDELVVLSEKMDKIFATLGTEERYLLEYKYFRRKSRLEGEFAGVCVSCSERTYFRRQARRRAQAQRAVRAERVGRRVVHALAGRFPLHTGRARKAGRVRGKRLCGQARKERARMQAARTEGAETARRVSGA